jgi:hypothetical protein
MEINGQSLINDPTIDPTDPTTWTPYIATSDTAFDSDTEKFREYVGINFEEAHAAQYDTASNRLYIPTFNQSGASLISDASGDAKDPWTNAATTIGDGTESFVTLGTIYTFPNSPIQHRAQDRITLRNNLRYVLKSNDVPFKLINSWFLDKDGWFYFTGKLSSNTATGSLVDSLSYKPKFQLRNGAKYVLKPQMEAVSLDEIDTWVNSSSGYDNTNTINQLEEIMSKQDGSMTITPNELTVVPGSTTYLMDWVTIGGLPNLTEQKCSAISIHGRTSQGTDVVYNSTKQSPEVIVAPDEESDELRILMRGPTLTNDLSGYTTWITIKIDHSGMTP